jgi:hypothetical protein
MAAVTVKYYSDDYATMLDAIHVANANISHNASIIKLLIVGSNLD